MKLLKFLILGSLALLFLACSDDDDNKNPTDPGDSNNGTKVMKSNHTEAKSHQNGQNCMNCHKSGGQAKDFGWFTIAGSLYQENKADIFSNSKAKIVLFTGANGSGSVKAEIPVDDRGNYYTTTIYDMTKLYPSVVSADGTKKKFMPAIPNSGQCYSCHGTEVAPNIWLNKN